MEKILKTFGNKMDGVRVILLIHRTKEGGLNNSNYRHVKKWVTCGKEEYLKAVEEAIADKNSSEVPYRIYSSVNSRNVDSAIRMYKQKLLDLDYDSVEKRNQFYIHSKNQFVSCLMTPQCRAEKDFLFDLDDCSERGYITILKRLERCAEVKLSYPTKNGYHIVTAPFNYYEKLSDDENLRNCINSDGLMLIDW